MNDSCYFSDDLLSPTGLYQYDDIISDELTSDYLNICFNKNGNLTDILDLDLALSFANFLNDDYTKLKIDT
eukprot:CAMPEP_0168314832 /NCGR_PEP_ID=MMETSP0210-20121227/9551_1 /TAXON_ID=40633 /ORGANISM="Condylostoma magnum, Strain COL2" /LENGTH=70 /DNA_ID=CAMNT_0008285215 /DNA_START=1157 /DNA_END=1369 /DNA_ORIENTATION=-